MSDDGSNEHWHQEGAVDFDWDSIDAGEARERGPDLDPDQRKRLAEAFLRVVHWQLRGIEKPSPGGTKGKARTIGIRAIALAYMLNPALLGGKRSAAQIARELGVSKKTMSVTIQSARNHLWGTDGRVSNTGGG